MLLSVLFSGFVLVILVVLRLSVLLSGSVLVILVVLRLSVLLSGSVLVILLVPVFWFLLSVLRVCVARDGRSASSRVLHGKQVAP